MKRMAFFVVLCVMLILPTLSFGQSAGVDPTVSRLLDLLQAQNTDMKAVNEQLIKLASEAIQQKIIVAPPIDLQRELQAERNRILSAQAGRQQVVVAEKQSWVGKYLVPAFLNAALVVPSAYYGARSGARQGTSSSFQRVTDVISKMPTPTQNINLSSFSGGAQTTSTLSLTNSPTMSMTPTLSSSMNTNATANPNLSSSASANPNVSASGGQGGQGGGGGQGGAGGIGGGGVGLGGSSSASADPFVNVNANASSNPFTNVNTNSNSSSNSSPTAISSSSPTIIH